MCDGCIVASRRMNSFSSDSVVENPVSYNPGYKLSYAPSTVSYSGASYGLDYQTA